VTEEQTAPAPVRATGRAVGVLVGTGVLVLLIDVLTKYLAVAHLTGRPPVRLLGGAVYLVLTRNSGAAFSLGTGYTFVFPVVSLLVVSWIGWMASRLRSLPWALALGLVLGGALGNLADRIFRAPGLMLGHVVDFVSLFSTDGHIWPIFNAADSGLLCGVILAVLLEMTGRRRDGTRVRPTRPDDKEPAERADD
jgi:lipoprotein signal peptidase